MATVKDNTTETVRRPEKGYEMETIALLLQNPIFAKGLVVVIITFCVLGIAIHYVIKYYREK